MTLSLFFQEPSNGKGSLYREHTLRGAGHAFPSSLVYSSVLVKEGKGKNCLKGENHHHQVTLTGLESMICQ